MTALAKRYRGVALMLDLNLDRLIYVIAIVGGLALGSYVGSFALMGLQGY
jgi:hypothetical protein